MPVPPPWTRAESDLLVTMANAGFSATQIAARLPGRSRNAVIGRVNRLDAVVLKGNGGGSSPGKVRRGKPSAPRKYRPPYDGVVLEWPTPKPARKTRPAKPSRKLPPRGDCPASTGEPLGLGILELGADQCRWPVSDGSPHTFCGQPVRADGSLLYCPHHHWVATKPTPGGVM